MAGGGAPLDAWPGKGAASVEPRRLSWTPKRVQKQLHEAPNSAAASSPLSELTAAASTVQVDLRDLPMCLCLRANSLAGLNNQYTQHPSIYRRQGQPENKLCKIKCKILKGMLHILSFIVIVQSCAIRFFQVTWQIPCKFHVNLVGNL